MMHPDFLGTCIIVTNKNGAVLLGRRKNGYKVGWYGMPGGRITLEETLLDGAARELAEETAVYHNALSYVGVVRENQENGIFLHFVFHTELGNNEAKLCEPEKCEAWEWFELEDLPATILPGHKSALKLYETQLGLIELL